MVVCLNLVKHKLSFLFAKILFVMNEKGKKPYEKPKGLKNHQVDKLMAIDPYNNEFIFFN